MDRDDEPIISNEEQKTDKYNTSKIILTSQFLMFGFLITFFGIWLTVELDHYMLLQTTLDKIFRGLTLTVGLISLIGGLISVIVFFKYPKNHTNRHVVFILQVAILTLIIVGEYGAENFAQQTSANCTNIIKGDVSSHFDNFLNSTEAKKFINRLQTEFKCCGITGPQDWAKLGFNDTLPNTCCGNPVKICTLKDSFKDGCATIVTTWVELWFKIMLFILSAAILSHVWFVILQFLKSYGVVMKQQLGANRNESI